MYYHFVFFSPSDEFFQSDIKSTNFLKILQSNTKSTSIGQTKCGLRPSNTVYPWHASVFINNDGKEQFICEATLIDESHVLTAAHCVTSTRTGKPIPRTTISIYLGEENASQSAVRANVSKIHVHSEYEVGKLFNDIAILELGIPLIINDFVRPICLNEGVRKSGSDIEGYNVGVNTNKEVLSENVSEISNEECLKRTPDLQNILTDGTICLTYAKGKT